MPTHRKVRVGSKTGGHSEKSEAPVLGGGSHGADRGAGDSDATGNGGRPRREAPRGGAGKPDAQDLVHKQGPSNSYFEGPCCMKCAGTPWRRWSATPDHVRPGAPQGVVQPSVDVIQPTVNVPRRASHRDGYVARLAIAGPRSTAPSSANNDPCAGHSHPAASGFTVTP